MGVIQRQSIKQSIVNYAAVGIAALSTIFIYAQDKEIYGLARFVIDTSLMLAPFIMLGFGSVTIRFFPHFRDDERGHRGFLFFLITMLAFGTLLFIGLFIIFQPVLYEYFADKPETYRRYLPYLAPIAILLAFIQLFYNYSANFKRIVVPAIFQNLIKISLPVLVLLYIWKSIDTDQLINGITLNYILALAGLILYIYWLGQLKLKPDFSLLTRSRRKEIRQFTFFSLFNNIGSILAFRIDLFMVPALLTFKDNGVYAIALFIANTIAIPTNAIAQISGPIITDALKDNDLKEIERLYKSSSINLLLIGLLLFVCIIASVEDLFQIMPKGDQMQNGLMIVFLIGFAKIIDMGTSINNQIINYSRYFRFGFYAIVLMAVFNISANIIFIEKYGLVGAALATLLSLSAYNLVKLLFILWKFKIQPFSIKSIYLIAIATISYGLSLLVPSTGMALLDILLKSIVIISLYVPIVYYLKISPEVERLILNFLNRFR